MESDEDVLSAARREALEEADLRLDSLELCGVINICTETEPDGSLPGVMVFVFRAESVEREVSASVEGGLAWIPVDRLAAYPLVDDLYEVIPRALDEEPPFFAHYRPDSTGILQYQFSR